MCQHCDPFMRIKHSSVLSNPSHLLRCCDLRFNDEGFFYLVSNIYVGKQATKSITCKNFVFIEADVSCLHPNVDKLEQTARDFDMQSSSRSFRITFYYLSLF